MLILVNFACMNCLLLRKNKRERRKPSRIITSATLPKIVASLVTKKRKMNKIVWVITGLALVQVVRVEKMVIRARRDGSSYPLSQFAIGVELRIRYISQREQLICYECINIILMLLEIFLLFL